MDFNELLEEENLRLDEISKSLGVALGSTLGLIAGGQVGSVAGAAAGHILAKGGEGDIKVWKDYIKSHKEMIKKINIKYKEKIDKAESNEQRQKYKQKLKDKIDNRNKKIKVLEEKIKRAKS